MSDSGAAIFMGEFLDFLSQKPCDRTREIARWVFRNSQFDFSWSQACAEEAIKKLLPDVCTSCWAEGGKHDERNCERDVE